MTKFTLSIVASAAVLLAACGKKEELRARRDALVVFFLGFFLVLTHFLYSQSLGTGLWMLVAVWGLLTALTLAHMPVGRPPLRRRALWSSRSAMSAPPAGPGRTWAKTTRWVGAWRSTI